MSTWTLPGYEIQELLGFGATGEVWRARSTATGETVALKRLRPGVGPEAVSALRREAAVLRTLETPFIVRLRAVVGAGAEAVLVLDHAAGGSLASLLSRRGVLPPGEVVTVAAPLAQALAVAHARGLVHGDVSPANVLFTGDGMPLLTDLGLARSVAEPRGNEPLHATAEYLDPAVAAGADPGPASDVWALGALCFHLLAGTPPYEGELVGQVLDAARTRSRAPLGLLAPHVPRALVAVVEGALHDDPTRRPSAGALAVALQRAQTSVPVRLDDDPTVDVAPAGRVTHAV
ncbi:MAG: Serine/threonine protein kinase, partial [Frankiales bacterium]|nr:Serine/threonine protein kinase [Frankiales bacterium]